MAKSIDWIVVGIKVKEIEENETNYRMWSCLENFLSGVCVHVVYKEEVWFCVSWQKVFEKHSFEWLVLKLCSSDSRVLEKGFERVGRLGIPISTSTIKTSFDGLCNVFGVLNKIALGETTPLLSSKSLKITGLDHEYIDHLSI